MRVAIVGSGWVGCHLAKNLMDRYEVSLYDSHGIFYGSSAHNQNRLHIGYHYCRDYKTRELCRTTYNTFLDEYGFVVDNVEKNYYVVPEKHSIIDYNTYLKIYDDFSTHSEVELEFLENCSGAINTEEKYINPNKCKNYFESILSDIYIKEEISESMLSQLQLEYDFVINATNNTLHPIEDDIYSEQCDTLLYMAKREIEFGALTFVDGKLFSLYPHDRENGIYSLSDVEHTPNPKLTIEQKRNLMESKVLWYYGSFLDDFEYHGYHRGKKEKVRNLSDCRVPLIKREGNLFSIFTGKIQGIYYIQETIENALKN